MSMNLEEFSDLELQNELAKRQAQAAKEALYLRKARFRKLVESRDALLALIPHGRTSCSDEKRINGFGSADYGARCTRCALLELNEFDSTEYDFHLELSFSKVDNQQMGK